METTTEQTKQKRQFTGVVVGIGAQHTVMVRVDRVVLHPKYQKRFTRSKKFACDYRKADVLVGDMVVFEETRPISKTKRWRIIGKVK